MLVKNATPAEIARGCCFAENFNSGADIRRNGGAISGSLGWDQNRGAYFDGTDYITYGTGLQPFSSGFWSAVIEFWPAFAASEATLRCFFDTTNASRTIIAKEAATKDILVYTGGTTLVLRVLYADYQAYWRANERNVLVVAARSGGNTAWLNGVQVGTSATAWTAFFTYGLIVGNGDGLALPFIGNLRSIKFFRHNAVSELFTAQEALDYYNGSTYNYRNKALVDLPLTAACHAPSGMPREVLVDGNMEAAGVAAWAPGGGGTLTKETTTPHGGLQCLRITKDGAAQDWCSQDVMTVGKTYRITGWARGDGTARPTISTNLVSLWGGTVSTAWQAFDVTHVDTGIGPYLNVFGGDAGNYADFDDISVLEYNPSTLDVSGKGNHFILGDGVTAAKLPTKDAIRGYTYDGVAQYMRSLDVSSNAWWKQQNFSVTVALKNDTLPAATYRFVFSTCYRVNADDGWMIYTYGNEIRFAVNSFATYWTAGTISPGKLCVVTGVYDRSGNSHRMYLDGKLIASGTAGSDVTYNAAGVLSLGRLGATDAYFVDGSIPYASFVPFALSHLQAKHLYLSLLPTLNQV